MEKLKKKTLIYLRALRLKTRRVLRFVVLPGFEGVPIYDVLVFFIKGLFNGYLAERAAAISFHFFLALFPLVLFIFTLIPYIPINDFQETLFALIEELLPPQTFDLVQQTIYEIINQQNTGLLSLSFIMTFFFSTSGIVAIMDGFSRGYHEINTISWVKQRIEAIGLLSILAVLLILVIALMTMGGYAIRILSADGIIHSALVVQLLQIVRWISIVIFMMSITAILYHYGTHEKKRFHLFSPGSILATALFIIGSFGFNFYITNFSRYNALYGSISTLLIILLAIYINSIILLIGFELNVSIGQARKQSKNQEINILKERIK
ncbi:MAG: YihY/virulence factor BrkB family protein [Lentimicrobiaceae bacterium]|jgi:membrane protein|nr:YihY/virulence factor BrkB family protein [Lentimicrobiaceae bacterium]